MGKQVPIKARKAGGAAAAPQAHKPSSGGRKHGGIGANNSFENLTYRSKHDVLQLGKAKGKLKRPAASQSASLAARQQALLAEFGARERANSFVDERLEEHNSALDTEDKLLLRFQKERQKRLAHQSKFALHGEEGEDNMLLTHQGQALALGGASQRREGEEEEGGEDEDEEAVERRLAASRAHNEEEDGAEYDDDEQKEGGGVKSKHEVMSEVMLKSKMYRAERAVLAGEQQDLMGNLDAEFDEIRGQMAWASREDREAARRGADAAAAAKKKAKGAEVAADVLNAEGDLYMEAGLDPTDEFVLEAKQLGLDLRARATDRLKSDEELLLAEKKRLERLEKLRVKRMRGESQGADEGDEEEDDDEPSAKRRRERREARAAASSGTVASGSASSAKVPRRSDDDLETNVKLTSAAVGGRSADQVDEHELISDDEEGAGKKGKRQQQEEDDEDESEEDSDDEEDSDEDEDEDEDMQDDGSAAEEDEDKPLKAVFIGSTPKPAAATPAASKGKAASSAEGGREIFIGKDGKSSVSSALLAITAKLAGKGASDAAPAASASASTASSWTADTLALPFTFPCPSSYKELKSILSQYPPKEHSTILSRMRTLHHVSLAPENKAKMERFYAVLLTHFRKLCTEYASKKSEEEMDAQSVQELVARLDQVAEHVVALTEQPALNAAVGKAWRGQLSKMRAEMDPSADADAEAVPGWKVDELMLMKFLASLFPTSDFRHNVVTPFLLLQCEWLSRLPVTGPADMLKGFFVVALLLHSLNSSKRIAPEVLTFLHAALLHGLGVAKKEGDKAPKSDATPATGNAAAVASANGTKGKGAAKGTTTATVAAPATPAKDAAPFSIDPSPLRLHSSLQSRNVNFVPSAQLALWAPLIAVSGKGASAAAKKGKKDASAQQQQDLHVPLHWLFRDNDSPVFAASAAAASASASSSASPLSVTAFSTLLQLIHQAAQLWHSSCPSYAELFLPILDTLGHVLAEQDAGRMAPLPPLLQTYTRHLHSYLRASSLHSISLRTPLEASLAPLALKTHQPMFVEGYNPTKDYDPIKERAHIKELSAKLKREKKGALRELRRDTQVVVQQQRAVQQAFAAEREEKRKQVWSQMEEQQRDTNIMARASKKKEEKKDAKKGRKK